LLFIALNQCLNNFEIKQPNKELTVGWDRSQRTLGAATGSQAGTNLWEQEKTRLWGYGGS